MSNRPVSRGDNFRPSAETWNQLQRSLQQRPGIGNPITESHQQPWCLCRNDSGADLRRLAAVSIDGVVFHVDNEVAPYSEEYFAAEPVMKAHKPDWRRGAVWGICLEPIADGKCGRVLVSGPIAIKLVGHRHISVAGPDLAAGSTETLKTGAGACPVIWQAPGTDPADQSERWGLILLGQTADIEGTITEAATPVNGMTGPAACRLKPWRYVDDQSQDVAARQMEQVDFEITAMNRDKSLTPVIGDYCVVRWTNHEWRLIWVGCE